jgi:hypothetical protein
MIGRKQKIVNSKTGDCFRACVASILEADNDKKLPNPHGSGWINDWFKYFSEFGMCLGFDKKAIWRSGYWIASVPSLNYKKTNHAIVMLGDKVAFDPSLKKTYRKGRNLSGKNIVNFGYWIELSDFSKLKRFFK